jgi:hypothetical protein
MLEGEEMSEEFRKFLQKEIKPILENYHVMNNREEWYVKWYLDPPAGISPAEYVATIFKLREDPKVTWQFKTFLLQLVSIINTRFS